MVVPARCCCACTLFEDSFEEEEIGERYEYTLGDWSQADGKLVVETADSLLYFHNGEGAFFHILITVELPTVGDYLGLYYGDSFVLFERVDTNTIRVFVGDQWVSGSDGVPSGQLEVMIGFFPRSIHTIFYDKFTTTPDTDLIGVINPSFLNPGPGTSEDNLPQALMGGCLPWPPSWIDSFGSADLSTPPATWGFAGSAGTSINHLTVYRGTQRCLSLGHSCCTVWWPKGQPDTAIVDIDGFAGMVGDCDWSFYNKIYVIDRPTAPGTLNGGACVYSQEFEGSEDCADRFVTATYILLDDATDTYYVSASIPSHFSLSPTPPFDWEATVTRAQICGGGPITMTPVGGGSTAGVIVTVEFA